MEYTCLLFSVLRRTLAIISVDNAPLAQELCYVDSASASFWRITPRRGYLQASAVDLPSNSSVQHNFLFIRVHFMQHPMLSCNSTLLCHSILLCNSMLSCDHWRCLHICDSSFIGRCNLMRSGCNTDCQAFNFDIMSE